ncbi:helicase-related protein [Rhodothermus marinus]|uniref:helicase-related protein n=1 Tax=Rhodothermus marinus TaxID=29549 RepID=UPI0012BA537D|nr:helicase-related protein [Rhodothermus marinus]BBM69558.1 helicase [Rhodothermus marinus]BBM72540.1 helicase [Rhodothermus marinus]
MSQNTHSLSGKWYYLPEYGELCQLIEAQALWGETVCRVWLPGRNAIVQLPASRLKPVEEAGFRTKESLAYVVAAARVADALSRDVLLAPVASSVIPLPHQIYALSRAISGDRVRYLLADEVGLGKTIEAGLIMRELKLRGLVRRTLVVAPKGLVRQWIAEMATHFNETFHLILSEDYRTLKRLNLHPNPFQAFDQVVVSMDSVKPPRLKQAEDPVRERFEDLITAGWDLIIVDEAHRLGGSTDQVARYRLGQALAEAAPYLLLLSATPHQGKTDQFRRLISLLDPMAFPEDESITRDRVRPYVIRTEKRQAIDPEGKPLFKPRFTQLAPIVWDDRHQHERLLYEAVTEYVRQGYNRAVAERRNYIGFLMVLMQRLVTSSTRAIRTTLERRLEALKTRAKKLARKEFFDEEEWADLDGQEQVEWLLNTLSFEAWAQERKEVEHLLELARRCERQGPDAKAEALLDWIYRLQAEENDPNLKVLIFTEFVPTQEMLYEFLTERGFKVVCINGSMDLEERRRAQQNFAGEARILVSTDAGGEGLNLQFCHVVINYDIPWNPMRLEQRIGRVDRIGQPKVVRAVNFVLRDSVEHRVLQVLEQKLAVILEELGVDKTGDVLDSAQAEQLFDELYLAAILHPEKLEEKAEELLAGFQELARDVRQSLSLLGSATELDAREAQRMIAHPFPHWVERMTVNYLQAHGGRAEKQGGFWALTWPDGEQLKGVVFSVREAEESPAGIHLTLEHPRVRGLAMRLPTFVPGQPVPVVSIPELSSKVQGFWSLWEISIQSNTITIPGMSVSTFARQRRMLPVFLADNGRVFVPTARHIWDLLLTRPFTVLRHLDSQDSRHVFERLRKVAEEQGQPLYEELVRERQEQLERERQKAEYAFAARRRAIERIGLMQVRDHRLRLLEKEEARFREQLALAAQVIPEMKALVLIRVEKEVHERLA